jgi:CubicO group peptidase (beta-lactamase class C family)
MVGQWLTGAAVVAAAGAVPMTLFGQASDSAPARLPLDWEVATPSSQGVDPALLGRISKRIADGEFGAVNSFLVARGGKLVYERYYRGWTTHQMHTVQSVTKSVASALVGIAIAEGKIKSVDQPLSELLPGYQATLAADPRKQKLTLRHVLTMTLGNDWNERAAPYSSPLNIVWRMALSNDWMAFVLDQPMIEEPGTRFNYASGSSLLLGGIIQHATGMQAHVYAEKKLFDPLGIPVYGWYRNMTHPAHWSHTGGGLNLRSRDLAKIGQLYVSRGVWKGQQIVPAAWVEESAKPRVQVSDRLWYGYQWWLLPTDSTTTGSGDVVHGRGWGGQYVFAVPKLDLVVVFNSVNFEDDRLSRRPIALVLDEIIPSIRGANVH